RDHMERLAGSPLIKELRESGRIPELQQMDTLNLFFKSKLGVELTQVRDEILGDAVVFAYRPGPPGKPQHEQGLILVQARDAQLLEKFIDNFNREEKENGKLKKLVTEELDGQ